MGFKVVGLDINGGMLEVAKKAGADVVFNSMTNKDYVEELKESHGRRRPRGGRLQQRASSI